jgi:hypothetical protein
MLPMTAMHVALLTGAGAALLAALATVILLAHRRQTAPEGATAADAVLRQSAACRDQTKTTRFRAA